MFSRLPFTSTGRTVKKTTPRRSAITVTRLFNPGFSMAEEPPGHRPYADIPNIPAKAPAHCCCAQSRMQIPRHSTKSGRHCRPDTAMRFPRARKQQFSRTGFWGTKPDKRGNMITHPPTPPYVPFGIRRFSQPDKGFKFRLPQPCCGCAALPRIFFFRDRAVSLCHSFPSVPPCRFDPADRRCFSPGRNVAQPTGRTVLRPSPLAGTPSPLWPLLTSHGPLLLWISPPWDPHA